MFEEFGDLGDLTAAPASTQARPTAGAPSAADALGAALAYDPVTLDALCDGTGMTAEAVSAALLQLELAGAAERLPGNRFRRLA
ncbi:DprA-like winged helix domain-containing protein [Cupriavidus sp. EM10]|uniref:DprA-like winged helix domain-containing protein n=1 Tax=Cupriavidus sp. EM10 TaxID=2839983 RepID=UPI0021045E61|nr:hypothetical protein [Cupriavidus sp. EM10]